MDNIITLKRRLVNRLKGIFMPCFAGFVEVKGQVLLLGELLIYCPALCALIRSARTVQAFT
jgi:hypothetical protein